MEKSYILLPPFHPEHYSKYLYLTGLFYFYSRLYQKVYYQFENEEYILDDENKNHLSLFLPSNFIYKQFKNKILLSNDYNIDRGIPYHIRFLYERLNRNIEKENEIKNNIISCYENVIPHFASSYLLKNYIHTDHTNIPFLTFDHHFYDNDIDHPYYHCRFPITSSEYLYLGSYIENIEELHIHGDDTFWLEIIVYMDLSKIKKRILYLYDKNHLENIKRKYSNICYFRIIYI